MTRIINDTKLDFKDVLIVPKRSELSSRNDVGLNRAFNFKHNQDFLFSGIPIMAANMDGVGTFRVAEKLAELGLFACIVKHYPLADLVNFFNKMAEPIDIIGNTRLGNIAYSLGISDDDLEKYNAFKKESDTNYVCIDVANGYTEKFVDFCKRFRDNNPDKVIIAGNVVTPEMTLALILAGVDVVKVGIGPGCFIPGSLVLTSVGLKPIEEIKRGDLVLTHKGNWKPVLRTIKHTAYNGIILPNGTWENSSEHWGILHCINNKTSTENHEYYVVEKKDKDLITDENIHHYAKWIRADNLNKEKYLLIEHVV